MEKLIEKIVKDVKTMLSESQMRAYAYYDEVRNIAFRIFQIIQKLPENADEMQVFKINGLDSRPTIEMHTNASYVRNYPNRSGAGGFMDISENKIVLRIKKYYKIGDIVKTIMHELEHYIDYTSQNTLDSIPYNGKQRNLQLAAYGDVYQTPDTSTSALQAKNWVTTILYHLWITTEKNAYISDYLNSNGFKKLQFDIENFKNYLWALKQIPVNEEYEQVWKTAAVTLNQTNKQKTQAYSVVDLRYLQRVKTHFIKQSYHKLFQYEETAKKKIMRYMQDNGMNGRELARPMPQRRSTAVPPPIPPRQTTQSNQNNGLFNKIGKLFKK